jgi:signal transduction histidine kinase/ActR/RegA family two-component response regulator
LRRRLSASGLVLTGAVAASAIASAAVAFYLWQSRELERQATAVNTRNLSGVLEGTLDASFDKVDSALLSVRDELVHQTAEGRRNAAVLEDLLRHQLERTPDAAALRIIDADGVVQMSAPPSERVGVADREYFVRLRDGAPAAVSKPFVGRIQKAPVIVMARRLVRPDGTFDGAVTATLELSRLTRTLMALDVGPHGRIVLRAEDMSLIAWAAREPLPNGLSQSTVSPQLRVQLDAGQRSGTYDTRSASDGLQRTYTFRHLAHHPFFVNVGEAYDDYLAGWRQQVVVAAMLLAAFVVLINLGAWLAIRTWRQQELSAAQLMRVQRIESLAIVAGGIAHDFNNLLTGIVGNISVAREQIPSDSPAAEALADAEGASLRARGLTHQLLTFARGGAPVRKPVDLGALTAEAARFAAHGAGTALKLELAQGLYVDADPGQLGQVVQNLVINGIQAMGSSGKLVVRVAQARPGERGVATLRPGRYATLSVQDGGPGIPSDLLPRIFDPFFTTKTTGKGLGLAICHSIVLKHDGHIEVTSPPGAGATFSVHLPLLDRGAADAAERAPAAPPPLLAARRVLVLDDEEPVRRLVRRLLEPQGCDVVEACDGQEAVDRYGEALAAGRPFDAVLMDLTIPGGMGGLEAFLRIRALDPDVAAVVSSGYSTDPVMSDWQARGFRGALAKPYVAGALREALGRLERAEGAPG